VSTPGLLELTGSYYDAYSIPVKEFTIPSHFDVYTPDNQYEYQCRVVLVPNPQKGATSWTLNGKYITIGVYRDEGRASARGGQLPAVSWSRVGTRLTFVTATPHGLEVGDYVDMYNINIATFNGTVTSVVDAYTFMIRTYNTGATSGGLNAVAWPTKIVNYYEDNIVFRILPSFALVDYATIQSIITATAPAPRTNTVTMYDITTKIYKQVPSLRSDEFNYDLSTTITDSSEIDGNLMYGQQFDASGNPLTLIYNANGQPAYNNAMNSKTVNAQISHNTTVDGATANNRVYVYDFYGLDINDPKRNPYNSSTLVYRDTTASSLIGNFAYAENAVKERIYTGSFLNDEFGNLAIGIQANNALIVRKQILPVAVDSFNKPIKQSSKVLGI
jgi:hypothetical protein